MKYWSLNLNFIFNFYSYSPMSHSNGCKRFM
jgi:hypothetical protein